MAFNIFILIFCLLQINYSDQQHTGESDSHSEVCPGAQLDVMLVVDGSGSLLSEFKHHQNILLDMLGVLGLGPQASRVALVRFSDKPEIMLRFEDDQSRVNIYRQISTLQPEGGSTGTAEAVSMAIKEMQQSRRASSTPVVVLLNDGHSKDPWDTVLSTALKLRETTPFVFVVTLTEDIYMPELILYSGDPARIFSRDRLDEFLPEFEFFLREHICQTTPEPIFTGEPNPYPLATFKLTEAGRQSNCGRKQVDFMIVFDSSGSAQDVFRRQLVLAKKLVQSLPDVGSRVRVGVMEFNDNYNTHLTTEESATKEEVLSVIERITHTGGPTQTPRALKAAIAELKRTPREGAIQSIVLFNDGHSQAPWSEVQSITDELKRSTVEFFAVALDMDVYILELQHYVGERRERIFREGDDSRLMSNIRTLTDDVACRVSHNLDPKPVDAPITGTQCDLPVDIMVVMDSSGSARQTFQKQKRLITRMVETIFPEQNANRIALSLVRFSGAATIEIPFKFRQTRGELVRKISRLKYTGGNTRTSAGIQAALEEFRRNGQVNSKRILVLVNDGNSQNTWEKVVQMSEKVANAVSEILVVSFSDVSFYPELIKYAGTEERIYGVRRKDEFIKDMEQLTCSGKTDSEPDFGLEITEIGFALDGSSSRRSSCSSNIDLVILLDRSGDGIPNFLKQRQLAVEVLRSVFSRGFRNLRVAVISYTNVPVVNVSFKENMGLAALTEVLNRIEFSEIPPNTVGAINLAVQELTTQKRFGPTKQVAILLSDGHSTESWNQVLVSSSQLLNTGTEVFAVSASEDAYLPELILYTGVEGRVYEGARRGQLSQDVGNMFGLCQESPPVSVTRPATAATAAPIRPTKKPCKPLDLLLIMDVSGSVEDDFRKQRASAIALIDSIPTDSRVAVAVVKFSDYATMDIPFSQAKKPADVKRYLETLATIGGSTSLARAVRTAAREIVIRDAMDPRAVVVIFSDGKSEDGYRAIEEAARELRDTNAEIYAVSHSLFAHVKELGVYTGSANSIFVNPRNNILVSEIGLNKVCNVETQARRNFKTLPSLDSSCKMDLLIVLDTSSSIEGEFRKQRDFALELIRDLPIGETKTRVAVVKFSDEAVLEFGFYSGTNLTDVSDRISKIVHTGGSTNLGSAIRLGVQELERTRRSDAKRITVIISDGNSKSKWSEVLSTAESLRTSSSATYAVTMSYSYSQRELTEYTGPNGKIYLDYNSKSLVTDLSANANHRSCKVAKKVARNGCKVDLVLILDTSGSVERAFEAEKAFALEIVRGIPIGQDSTRVAFIRFAERADIVLDFYAGQSYDRVVQTVRDTVFTGGSTGLVDAVQLAIGQLQTGKRHDAQPAVVIITDGQSRDPWNIVKTTSQQLHGTKADVYAATLSAQFDQLELETYATSPENVFTGGNAQHIRQQLESVTNCMRKTWPIPEPILPPVGVIFQRDSCKVDVIIVLDTSGSVERDFELERDVALKVARALPIADDATKVALVTFSSTPELVFGLNSVQNSREVIRQINEVQFTGGETDLASAVDLATTQLYNYARIESKQMVILITDGNSKNPWPRVETTSKKLLDTGAEVYSITTSQGYSMAELTEYAGTDSKVFVGGNVQSIISKLESQTSAASCRPRDTYDFTDPPYVYTTQAPVDRCKLDIVVILDTSGSVEEEFESERTEVLRALEQVPIGPSAAHVSLITFHETPTLQLSLYDGQDKATVLRKVREVIFTGGGTRIAAAVRLAMTQLQRARHDARKVAALLSDGNSGDLWQTVVQTSKELRATGAIVYVVTQSSDYSRDELGEYAGDLSSVSLGRGSLAQKLTSLTHSANCHVPQPTLPYYPQTKKPYTTNGWTLDCSQQVDVVLILDTSGSVEDVFQKEKGLALKLASIDLPVGKQVSVAVVSFSSTARLVLSLNQDRKTIVNKIQEVIFTGGDTGILEAMKIALNEFQSSRNYRSAKVVVLISDGNSRDEWVNIVNFVPQLHKVTQNIFAVSYSRTLSMPELEMYTGIRDRVYQEATVPAFLSAVQNKISDLSCDHVTQPPYIPTQPPVWKPRPIPELPRPLCQSKYDVIIVFDTSGSREREFLRQKEIAMKLIRLIPTRDYSIAVSLVSFADSPILTLPLKTGRTAKDLEDGLASIEHTGGNTGTSSAVNMVLGDYQRSRRSEAASVFILISDGQSQDPWRTVLETSSTVKGTMDEIFALGLGDISMVELTAYTGNEQRIYKIHQEQQFLNDVRSLLTTKCGIIDPGPSPWTRPPIVPPTACKSLVDFVVIVDASGSVEEVFQFQKGIVLDLIGALPLPPTSNTARLGLVEYAQNSRILMSLSHTNLDAMKQIGLIEYLGGSTATVSGIENGLQVLGGARPNARKVVILVSDGHSQDIWNSVEATARRLREAADDVLVITLSPDIYMPELLEYAGSQENIYDKPKIHLINGRVQRIVSDAERCPGPRTSFKLADSNTNSDVLGFQKSSCRVDLLFLWDTSTSMTKLGFTKERLLILRALNKLNVGGDNVRVGITRFSGENRAKTVFSFSESVNISTTIRAAEAVNYTRGVTRPDRALDLARLEFETHSGPSVRKVCIVVTDGFSFQSPLEAADKLRELSVEVYSVGVSGNKGEETDKWINNRGLTEISGSADRIFYFDRLDNFYTLLDSLNHC